MNITQEEWANGVQRDGNDSVIIDVRTEDEFNEGRIPNAVNLDIYKGQGFIYKLEELDKQKSYYVYCKSGGRSEQACAIMGQLGFESAYNLVGGITQWRGEVIND